jgi:hypothetical protein
MNEFIDYMVQEFKHMWWPSPEIEGHIISKDEKQGRTLLLVKENDRMWKTIWCNDSEFKYKTPDEKLNSIFSR